MTQYTKPSVLPAWAETGDKTQPTNPEIQTGWPLSTTPPSRQRFNWILNWAANAVRYFMQNGIPDWDSAEDYPANSRVKLNGTVYRALIGTGNVNFSPATNPTYWKNEATSWYADDTGAVNAYVVNPSLPPNAYFDGMVVGFSTTNQSTSSTSTVNVNGLGAVAITLPEGKVMPADAIKANTPLFLVYNSTGPRFELQNAAQLKSKNLIPNSTRLVSQINGATLLTPASGTWPIDHIYFQTTQASKLQCQQVTNQLNALGAVSALAWSVLSSYTPVATDAMSESTPIIGYDFARYQWGTANAKPMSLQFKVNAPAGTYSGAIQNYAKTRSYPFSFTISAADVAAGGKLVKIENIPGDTAAAWVGAVNAGAAYITFDLGSGANFKGTANAWASFDYRGVTGASNLVSQANATVMAITEVMDNVGTFCADYDRKEFDAELHDCSWYLPSFTATQNQNIGVATFYSAVLALMELNWPRASRIPVTGVVATGNWNVSQGAVVVGANVGSSYNSSSYNNAVFSAPVAGATAGYSGIVSVVAGATFTAYGTGAQI